MWRLAARAGSRDPDHNAVATLLLVFSDIAVAAFSAPLEPHADYTCQFTAPSTHAISSQPASVRTTDHGRHSATL
jgi:hypothetical protein